MSDKLTDKELQSLRNMGCEFERAADEIVRLRAELAGVTPRKKLGHAQQENSSAGGERGRWGM